MARRKNANNTGKQLESTLESVHRRYRKQGVADIEKIDPPVKVLGGGIKRRVVFLENPWLDYGGVIAGGMAVHLEAKSTDGGTLPCGGDNGITDTQYKAMRRWQATGAVVGCLWYCFEYQEARIVTVEDIEITLEHRKSVKWETARPFENSKSFDYLPALIEITENRKRYGEIT